MARFRVDFQRLKHYPDAMQTTLEIDDDVLRAAEKRALAEQKTAGQLISEIVRSALVQPSHSPGTQLMKGVMKDGWFVLEDREGVVTSAAVERLVDEEDDRNARLAGDFAAGKNG